MATYPVLNHEKLLETRTNAFNKFKAEHRIAYGDAPMRSEDVDRALILAMMDEMATQIIDYIIENVHFER